MIKSYFNNTAITRLCAFGTIAAAVLLTACGYHLRGAYKLPKELKAVHLQGESSDLREQFRRSLQSSAGDLVPTPDKAAVIVRFFNEKMQRRVLSLSSRGRANEFELDYQLEYELLKPGETVLLARQPLEVRREYFNDQQDIIAKDNEEKVIRNEMYQQAVRTIVNRARAILEASAK